MRNEMPSTFLLTNDDATCFVPPIARTVGRWLAQPGAPGDDPDDAADPDADDDDDDDDDDEFEDGDDEDADEDDEDKDKDDEDDKDAKAGGEAGAAPEHEGATEDEVGDRTGPGVGYDTRRPGVQ